MSLANIIGEAGLSLLKSETAPKLSAEFFEKDAGFLGGLEKSGGAELTEKITEHLIKEGRPGSSEYMGLFSKSTILDNELKLLESGKFDTLKAEQSRLPVMIDLQRTTPEMAQAGQVILTPEAQTEFIGSINTLKYKLDTHIEKTAQKAADHYAIDLTQERSVSEKLKELLGIKPEPYEIDFKPNEVEITRLKELADLKYGSREEAQQTFRKELKHIMRRRPQSIGLQTTSSMSKFVGELAQDLSDNTNNAMDASRLRHLHEYMKGQGMEELQIYPEFGTAIESSIEKDLSQQE